MKLELKRIAPLRAANVGALVYGIFFCVIAVCMFPFLLLGTALAPRESGLPAGPEFAVVVLALYPILGVVVGWLTGLLTAALYNLVIRASGGLLLELDDLAAAPSGD